MNKKHILSLDELVDFCEKQNFMQFSSKDSGYSLHVQIPCESFEMDDTKDDVTFFANVRLMHTGRNRNRSSLTEKGAKSCLSSIAYKPVLADFTDINGEKDFTYHAMEFNDDGSRTYIERQVGCFTADKPYMKQDPDHEDRKYIYAKVAIPREYTDAAEIIERKGGTKVSAELSINEMSYSAEESLLYLDDVEVMGCTLLGTDPDTGEQVQEGMEGAYLQIEDFSAKNNSVINKDNLIDEITAAVLQRLDYKLDQKIPDNCGKEESGKMDNENINVEFEETEVKEVEVEEAETEEAEVEATEEETVVAEEETSEETAAETPEVEEDFEKVEKKDEDDTEESDDDAAEEEEPEEADDEDTEEDEETDEDEKKKFEDGITYSVTVDGITKEFAVSLADKINALTTLVNDTYAESDNAYYYVDVFEEDRYVIMHDFWNDRHFKQEFQVKKDVYSLKSDRVPVYPQYLTLDEIAKLEKMKSDFSAIESELNAYKSKELHSQREATLASAEYSVMADFAEFTELKNHMDDYSVEELTKEADLLYAKFMKSNYSTFAANKKDAQHSVVFMTSGKNEAEERLPYGGLFKNFKAKK